MQVLEEAFLRVELLQAHCTRTVIIIILTFSGCTGEVLCHVLDLELAMSLGQICLLGFLCLFRFKMASLLYMLLKFSFRREYLPASTAIFRL
jgi:hypothetical protein